MPKLSSGVEFQKFLKFLSRLKTQRKINEILEAFFAPLGGPWGVLGESVWSLERPRSVFGAPLERPWTRNAYKTFGFSMISNSILFTFGPSLWGAGRSLEQPRGVFGASLVPIGPFWGEKDGSQELRRAPTSSGDFRRAPRESGRRQVRRLRGSMRETLNGGTADILARPVHFVGGGL